MKKGFVQWLLAGLGYLVYTLAVLVVLLWVLFPVDSFRYWLQGRLSALSPGMEWKITSVKRVLPFALQLSGISVRDRKAAWLEIEELEVRPSLTDLKSVKRIIPARYRMKTLGGSVEGQMRIDREKKTFYSQASLNGVQLGMLEALWQRLNREGKGSLSGDLEFSCGLSSLIQGEGEANLVVRDGGIGLAQPILGQESLEFTQARATIRMKDGVMTVEQGEVESHLLAGSYDGTITFSDNLATSSVDLKGSFEPRPELLGGMENQATVSLIRSQLQDGKLSYSINGTVLAPGILFEGASGIIDGIIEGGIR